MKKLFLNSILFLSILSIQGQTQIILTFQARDSLTQNPVSLDSVNVMNLTENCDTNLYEAISHLTLLASWPVGIDKEDGESSGSFILMQNVPNPFRGSTLVRIYLRNSGELNLVVYDNFGKKLSGHEGYFAKGWHLFAVSTSISQLMFLNVSDPVTTKTIKLISTGIVCGGEEISYQGQSGGMDKKLKLAQDAAGFIFYLGNHLQYTAYVNGYHPNILYDNPVSSETYTFPMLPVAIITIPSVSTAPVNSITQTTATSGGNVISDGGAAVTSRGVCWSTSPNPTLANNTTNDGTGTGVFVSYLTTLTPNTIYFLRAYATNSAGTAYGEELTFATLSVTQPEVTTTPASYITQTTVTTGGNVTSDGGAAVTARGVCWSTSPTPTTAGNHTTDGGGTGAYVSNLNGLAPNTPYYIRAYAINSIGTAYGSELTFTTLSLAMATVNTTPATNITQTTATSGGNVISDGGATVTARGVCWSTTSNPTTAGNHTTDGNGTGIFISNITGLTMNTPYYIRAYATNSIGTAYGNELTFTTQSTFTCGSALSYEGKNYNTVQIGTQCWFKQNLNVGIRINGSQNQTNNSIMEKYCIDDVESNCDVYGGLYQWDEMMQYITSEGVKGLCPDGWHIPTHAEWTALVSFIGSPGNAGGFMKETGFAHWSPPNYGATNSSGFTAFGDGRRLDSGTFCCLTLYTTYWTSTQFDATTARVRELYYDQDFIATGDYIGKASGFSVRCLKN